MKKQLGAAQILANIAALKGFATKRQLADFFGVGPSAITDWTNRKGDRIPARRLAQACHVHGLRWEWLAYGEEPPYATQAVDNRTGLDLAPSELELLERVKSSANFREAVDKLLGLPEDHLRMIAMLAAELKNSSGPRGVRERTAPYASGKEAANVPGQAGNEPFLRYDFPYP